MNYTQTHAKIKQFEQIWTALYVKAASPAKPAEIAAKIAQDPEMVEAVAAIVKQYSHDPRISRRARQWADKVKTCFERCPGGYVSTSIHQCHISQTAEAIDKLQAAGDDVAFFCCWADDYMRSISGAIEAVRNGSTTEKGYLLEKIDLLRKVVETLP